MRKHEQTAIGSSSCFFEQCRLKGLRLNPNKVKLHQSQVSYLEHLLTKEGVKPDPQKVQAVVEMPPLTDVPAVRRFIGFVIYLSKFLPKLSDLCHPHRQLTQRDIV